MPFKRYELELAFEEPMSVQQRNRLRAWELATKAILPDAVIINEGQMFEENTKRFVTHTCDHDLPESERKGCKWEDV